MPTLKGILAVILVLVICFSLGGLFIVGGNQIVDNEGKLTQGGQISVNVGIVLILLGIGIVVAIIVISHFY